MVEHKAGDRTRPVGWIAKLRRAIVILVVFLVVISVFSPYVYPRIDYVLRIYLGIPKRPMKLSSAIKHGDIETIAWYVSRGTNLNALPPRENSGSYPLNLACARGEYAISKLFLDNGASPNPTYPDDGSITDKRLPLAAAVVSNSTDIQGLLLERGADVHAVDGWGRTVMHWVALRGEYTAELLVKAGARVNVKDDLGMTPLHLAAAARNTDIMKYLVALGADPDELDSKGSTPLHLCVPDYWTSEALLSLGADPNIRADMDADFVVIEVWDNRIRHGYYPYIIGIHIADYKGWTPLHGGTAMGNEAYVKLLLEFGARVDIKDEKGRTPLDIARLEGHSNIVTVLEEWTKEHPHPDDGDANDVE